MTIRQLINGARRACAEHGDGYGRGFRKEVIIRPAQWDRQPESTDPYWLEPAGHCDHFCSIDEAARRVSNVDLPCDIIFDIYVFNSFELVDNVTFKP